MPGEWTDWLIHSSQRPYRKWVENGQARLFQWDSEAGPYTDSKNKKVSKDAALTITSATPRFVPEDTIRRPHEASREAAPRRESDNRVRQGSNTQVRYDTNVQARQIDHPQARRDSNIHARQIDYNQARRDSNVQARQIDYNQVRRDSNIQAQQRSDVRTQQDSDDEDDQDGEVRRDNNTQVRREIDSQTPRDTNIRARRDTDVQPRERLDPRDRGNIDSRTRQTTSTSIRTDTDPRMSSEKTMTSKPDRRYNTMSDSRGREYETVTASSINRAQTTQTGVNIPSRQTGAIQTGGGRGDQTVAVTQDTNDPRINNRGAIFQRQEPSDTRSTGRSQQGAPGAVGGSPPSTLPRRPSVAGTIPDFVVERALRGAIPLPLSRSNLLDEAYKVHHTKDFKRGWVFQILWHENHGGRPRFSTTDASAGQAYGEPIYSSVRRMVVIQQNPAFSICVPINTYGGRGCLKPGLTKEEVKQHAVVHAASKSADPENDELRKGLIKSPIAVKMDYGETLNKWSRLRFDKFYTVEHVFRVKSIGNVIPAHISLLVQYFREGTAISD